MMFSVVVGCCSVYLVSHVLGSSDLVEWLLGRLGVHPDFSYVDSQPF